ncbi:MAG: sensor domain-containing diguanylate cyclase [Thermodesulfobacteriota bacterium]
MKAQIGSIFEDILETVREPFLVLDSDLKVLKASGSFYQIFRITPKETLGHLIYDLGNRQWDIPWLRRLLEDILPKDNKIDNYQVEHFFPNIGYKIMLLNARRIIQKDVGSEIILLAIEDLTGRRRQEGLLGEPEELYRRLFETAGSGILFLDKNKGNITYINPAFRKMLGYSEEESIGNKLQDVGFPPDLYAIQKINHILNKDGMIHNEEVSIKNKAGQVIYADIYLINKTRFIQCNIRNVTERKKEKEALKRSEERFRTIADFTYNWEYWLDPNQNFLYSSLSCQRITGYPREDFLKDPKLLNKIIHPDDREIMIRHNHEISEKGEVLPIDFRIIDRTGREHWIAHVCYPVVSVDGRTLGQRATNQDVTERKLVEEALKAMSLEDDLTGLYNRRGFLALAGQELKLANRMKRGAYLLFNDLDGLKVINDNFGHPQGDQALIDTARILKETFRDPDILARIGGDEFVILAIEAAPEAGPELLLERLKKNLDLFNEKSNRPYQLSLSMGVVGYDPEHPVPIDDLLIQADNQMYEEKQRKKKLKSV